MSINIVYLRTFAIFLIVIGHSIILYSSWDIMPTTISSPIFRFIKERFINPYQLNIFFAISGFLYYYTLKCEKSFLNVIKTKWTRLMIPYFLVAVIWMNPIKYLLGTPGYTNFHELCITLLGQIVMDNNGHLWYLPALMSIFLITYTYKYVCNNLYAFLVIMSTLLLEHFKFLFVGNNLLYNTSLYLFPFTLG